MNNSLNYAFFADLASNINIEDEEKIQEHPQREASNSDSDVETPHYNDTE